jgi:serine/threonine-protein kinase Chk1
MGIPLVKVLLPCEYLLLFYLSLHYFLLTSLFSVKVATVKQHVFAIKFIHRKISHHHGLSDEAIGKEVLLHRTCSGHPNVISLLHFGTDSNWLFIAMELATGGDLFDKIEPDKGVDEQVAHFFFKQMINAVEYCHQKGVAHRDIKPENILLDKDGNLKLADFGLAAVFKKKDGSRRLCNTPCGSPPYMAPEIARGKYDPAQADVWSCGAVLFVMLSGETPWDEPTKTDPLFKDFLEKDGKVFHSPWNKFSPIVLSILRMVMKPDVDKRSTIEKLRAHPWVSKDNPLSTPDGMCKDPLLLTARLLENLHIGLTDEHFIASSNDQYESMQNHFTASQPVADIAAMLDDQDSQHLPSTQQEFTEYNRAMMDDSLSERESIFKIISKDPAILQFSSNRSNLSQIEHFRNVERLTRFFSVLPIETLVPIILSSLNSVGISTSGFHYDDITEDDVKRHPIQISVVTVDRRKMYLRGSIKISQSPGLKLKIVEFVKTKGDPLEWRRFFKKITIQSREAVYI